MSTNDEQKSNTNSNNETNEGLVTLFEDLYNPNNSSLSLTHPGISLTDDLQTFNPVDLQQEETGHSSSHYYDNNTNNTKLSEEEEYELHALHDKEVLQAEEVLQLRRLSIQQTAYYKEVETNSHRHTYQTRQNTAVRKRIPNAYTKILTGSLNIPRLTGDAASLPGWLSKIDGVLYQVGLLSLTLINKWTRCSQDNRDAMVSSIRLSTQYKTVQKNLYNGYLPKLKQDEMSNQSILELYYLVVIDTCEQLEQMLFTVISDSISTELKYLLPQHIDTEIVRKAYFSMVLYHCRGTHNDLLKREAELYKPDNNTIASLRSIKEDPYILAQRLLTEYRLINMIHGSSRKKDSYITLERLALLLRRGVVKFAEYKNVYILLEKMGEADNFHVAAKELHEHFLDYVRVEEHRVPQLQLANQAIEKKIEKEIETTTNANSAAFDRNDADKPKGLCWQWLKTKTCKFGKNCKFKHEEPSKISAHIARGERRRKRHETQQYNADPSDTDDNSDLSSDTDSSTDWGETFKSKPDLMRVYQAGLRDRAKARRYKSTQKRGYGGRPIPAEYRTRAPMPEGPHLEPPDRKQSYFDKRQQKREPNPNSNISYQEFLRQSSQNTNKNNVSSGMNAKAERRAMLAKAIDRTVYLLDEESD
jgi:hypothetical protein